MKLAFHAPFSRLTTINDSQLNSGRLSLMIIPGAFRALVVSVSDDAFATGAGVKRLLSYYPRLFPLQHILYTPADAGTRRIGHFGFFGRHAGAALWPRLLAQLEPSPN